MKKVILHLIYAFLLLIFSVTVAALAGYASSMVVLLFGIPEYGEYIMCGVFLASTIAIFVSNYNWLESVAKKKSEESEAKQRDYFKDGNFSRK